MRGIQRCVARGVGLCCLLPLPFSLNHCRRFGEAHSSCVLLFFLRGQTQSRNGNTYTLVVCRFQSCVAVAAYSHFTSIAVISWEISIVIWVYFNVLRQDKRVNSLKFQWVFTLLSYGLAALVVIVLLIVQLVGHVPIYGQPQNPQDW